MEVTIKIPDTTSDMTIKHLRFFLALSEMKDVDIKDLSPAEAADLNTLFFGVENREFDLYDAQSNRRILSEIMLSCSKMNPQPIKPQYTIGDTTYVWQSDYSKQPTSFHRDIALADFENNPLDLVAFCYIEKGMTYNELDKNKNIINPRRERGEAFRNHLSLQDYLDISGFFLESYAVFRPYLKMREKIKAKQGNGIGRSR